jgi:2-methylcitrate synthase/citrate synthase II
MTTESSSYSPGLEGIIAGTSAISHIDPEQNALTYRGYNIEDLCEHARFEEVAYLLLYGELPDRAALSQLTATLAAEQAVPDTVYQALRLLPPDSDPMDWLKVAVAALALYDPQADENGHDANIAKAIRLTAKLPSILANGWRILQGQSVMPPVREGSHAARFLQTLTGEEPDPFAVRALSTTLILYAEHGFNASTFTARVTVSTQSDLYSGVVSAIGALKGPLHGGANEEVMRMLLEIGEPENAATWLERRLTKTPENPRPRIMGFGHREYKRGDQRAQIVRGFTHEMAERTGQARWTDITVILERAMLAKGLHPNLDFPVSPLYYMMGLPIPLYTPIFVLSRVVGWSAHIIEQLDNNRLIRPTSLYTGLPMRPYVRIEDRDAGSRGGGGC